MFEVQRQVMAGYQVLGEWRHRKKDGSIFHVETRTHPLVWEGRRAVLAMANDITARKQTEEAMRDSDRQKDEFLAMLAHELRNPLAPIRASTAILRSRAAADPMLQRCRDIIERQTGHMARLLDDLLDVSRLSRGKLTLQRSPVLLREALDAAIETSRPLIERQSQQLMIEAEAAAVVLDADSARLTQVFANLLNNAARYSHPGGRIELRVHPGEGSVTVSVRDEGIGIEAPMLGCVFDLFAQGAEAREHAEGGLGIGLSLARRLVEMHGGAISARSAGPGQGSTFSVTLPVLVAANQETPGDATRIDALVPGCRILIADDNVDAADTMAMLFEGMQCKVRTVYAGAAAAWEAEHFQPDVVLLDLGMPDVDGYEACRRIRAAGSGEGMLIVAISGWGRDADLQKSMAAGFDHHLLKPVDPDALIRLIRDAQRVSS
jgi:signal transduction histidine kinase/ActR/RegA family two-component response regulator